MKIAIAFYGITRSLRYTIDSIERQIFVPARAAGQVKVYAHFFMQVRIDNPRTDEVGLLDTEEWQLLNADQVLLEPPDIELEDWYVSQLFPFGNAWEDQGQSLRNILRQLISLERVTRAIEADAGADVVVFVRSDLRYHDPFDFSAWASSVQPLTVIVPFWQWSGGLNDRFAVCGCETYGVWGLRIQHALRFCRTKRRSFHAERLLMDVIKHSPVRFTVMPLRATRIRMNGGEAAETFHQVKVAKRIEAWWNCVVCPLLVRLFSLRTPP